MARHLLCPLVLLLLLLLLPACAGELCRAWAHGWASPVDLFVCPRPGARDAAEFCCGSCRQPYCCASEVARLDQRQCLVEAQTARPPTTPPPNFPTLWIVAWVSFGALALTITAVAVHCFCAHRCPRAAGCLKSHRTVQPIKLVPINSASQCPSLDRSLSSHSGSPPSYATHEDAEPSSTAGTPQSRQVFIPVFGNNTPFVWFHHRNSRLPGDGASASPPTDLSDGETAVPTTNLL